MRAEEMDQPVPGWGSDWDNVKFVRIGMLIRSAPGARPDLDSANYQLFGSNYPADNSVDPGATMDTKLLSNTERTRLRRVVTSTITIRNRINQWATLTP